MPLLHRLRSVVTAAAVATAALLSGCASAPDQSTGIPIFEVDASWPQVPPQWKLGDPSSIAVDAQDRIYVLHRPRTLKGPDAAKAAPPVIIFDAAGHFVNAWGGASAADEWPQR